MTKPRNYGRRCSMCDNYIQRSDRMAYSNYGEHEWSNRKQRYYETNVGWVCGKCRCIEDAAMDLYLILPRMKEGLNNWDWTEKEKSDLYMYGRNKFIGDKSRRKSFRKRGVWFR